ncbi:MAG: hypothetical protein GY787_19035 [Alteromonadales bacterium]|nr:hypothetical protein [Alteromonadales bacterium]
MNNTAITTLLAEYKGFPIIYNSIIPEGAKGLPAISFNQEGGTPSVSQQLRRFKIDCWGRTSEESILLAETVTEELNGKDHDIGVSAKCTMLDGQPNPNAKEVNTPVECRLIKIGGA